MYEINVICLPFAGGNKFSYREYQRKSPQGLNFIALEYAGHGTRIREPLMESINSIAQDMYEKTLSIAEKGNYAVYGHSMGASVGFELIHQLLENGKPAPLHFFATGATGPSSLSRQERNWHHLPKNELIDKLRDLQGCPDEIFEDSDLLDFLLPIIRSDFKAVETFRYTKRPPLEIPISVVTGTEEPLKDEEVALWQNETAFAVNFQKMNGGHFFINACATSVVNHIAKTIRNSKIN